MRCKNCKTNLSDTDHYCRNCGAKVINERLTVKNILQNVSVQFFNYDSKLIKTFMHLITQPETVIVGYINGVRKRYINLLQYFAIALTITGLQFFIFNTFFDNPFGFKAESFGVGSDVPNPKSIEKYLANVSLVMNNYYSLIYILSIPFSALGSWFVYKIYEKRYNFAEHIVINTFYSAQLLIVLAFLAIVFGIFGVSYMDFSLLSLPITFAYFWFVLKRVYKMTFLESIAYMLFYIAVYGVIFILLGLFSLIITVLIVLMLK